MVPPDSSRALRPATLGEAYRDRSGGTRIQTTDHCHRVWWQCCAAPIPRVRARELFGSQAARGHVYGRLGVCVTGASGGGSARPWPSAAHRCMDKDFLLMGAFREALLGRWKGASGAVFVAVHSVSVCNLRRLSAKQTRFHSAATLRRPRMLKDLKPSTFLTHPKTGSTIPFLFL